MQAVSSQTNDLQMSDSNLADQARQFKIQINSFQENYLQNQGSNPVIYYLISTQWIQDWKHYVYYNQAIYNEQFVSPTDRPRPTKMNADLIDSDAEEKRFLLYAPENNYMNRILKDGLVFKQDYIVVSKILFDNLKAMYKDSIQIKRCCLTSGNQKRMEIYLTKNLSKGQPLPEGDFYVSMGNTAKGMCSMIGHRVNAPNFTKLTNNPSTGQNREIVNIWKFQTGMNLDVLKSMILNNIKHEKQLYFENARLIGHSDPSFLSDLNIAPNDIFIFDVREDGKPYYIDGQTPPTLIRCTTHCCLLRSNKNYCCCTEKVFQSTRVQTAQARAAASQSNSMVYEEAQMNQNVAMAAMDIQETKGDPLLNKTPQKFGLKDNNNNGNSQSSSAIVLYNSSSSTSGGLGNSSSSMDFISEPGVGSRFGNSGLSNLGNTCYMNSGLQCLSHTKEFVEYFLKKQHIDQINKDNVLGTKGVLAESFAQLLSNLHFGTSSSVSPWDFKHEMGKFQNIFSGYGQQDAQEFISFLLDGIHQDLNRVKKKKVVEKKESQGRSDVVVAQETWFDFILPRNDSVVVDNFYGLYQSKIQCPTCDRISITFDPFSVLSLPLQSDQTINIEILIWQFKSPFRQTKFNFKTKEGAIANLGELKQEVSKQLKILPTQIEAVLISDYTKDFIEDQSEMSEIIDQLKYRDLQFRYKATESESKDNIQIVFHINVFRKSYYSNSEITQKVSKQYYMEMERNLTFEELQLSFLKEMKFLLPQGLFKEDLNQQSEEANLRANYEALFVGQSYKQAPWHWILSHYKLQDYWQNPCFFCKTERCSKCACPYSEKQTIGQYYDKMDSTEKYIEIEFILNSSADREQSLQEFFQKCIPIEEFFDQQSKNNEEIKLNNDQSNNGIEQMKNEEMVEEQKGILQCFKSFQEPQILDPDNEWYCSKCQQHKQAQKELRIYKAPQIFIIHIKRFKRSSKYSFYDKKNEDLVEFPIEGLNISQYVTNHELPYVFSEDFAQETQKQNLLYDLFAVSNHYGSINFGHYTAYAQNLSNNEWFEYNDSSVYPVSDPKKVITKDAYVLFYRRRE